LPGCAASSLPIHAHTLGLAWTARLALASLVAGPTVAADCSGRVHSAHAAATDTRRALAHATRAHAFARLLALASFAAGLIAATTSMSDTGVLRPKIAAARIGMRDVGIRDLVAYCCSICAFARSALLPDRKRLEVTTRSHMEAT